MALCSRQLHNVLEGLENVSVYLDDILVHAPSKEIHDKALEQVLSRIDKHGLSLNMRKCKFNVSKVNYLGYEIFDGCVKPDPERVKPILNFPLATSSKALQ